MRGLNIVLFYMGSSFDEVAKGWVSITSGKFLCVIGGVKLFCVVDVSLWCLFC
jgi:hypothetical protein